MKRCESSKLRGRRGYKKKKKIIVAGVSTATTENVKSKPCLTQYRHVNPSDRELILLSVNEIGNVTMRYTGICVTQKRSSVRYIEKLHRAEKERLACWRVKLITKKRDGK